MGLQWDRTTNHYKETHQLVKGEALHNTLTKFRIPMKLIRLVKINLQTKPTAKTAKAIIY